MSTSTTAPPQLDVDTLLDAAVAALGGARREGQHQMAHAVAEAMRTGTHLLVQAGTGTGKSLAYLIPALVHARTSKKPVVISTATLALQSQIVSRDLPRVADALASELGDRPTWQVLKGRSHYVCQQQLLGGFPVDQQELFANAEASAQGATSRLGQQIVRVREWASETETGDRDELTPGISDAAWRQVSVSARECLGPACSQVRECFSEQARAAATQVDMVVTNHAMVAIDSFSDHSLLPEHEVLVLDEGHEVADRVTSVVTQELTVSAIEVAARRAGAAGSPSADLLQSASALAAALSETEPGRLLAYPESLTHAITLVRDAARAVGSALRSDPGTADASRQLARAAVGEVFEVAERLADYSGSRYDPDVVWFSRITRSDGGIREGLQVAPVSVAGQLATHLYDERTVILTSATMTVGGTFTAAAGRIGLGGANAPASTTLDVGSPFDYPQQGMLYIAKHLPAPGREGMAEQTATELAELITAAGGRTLGLFSSRRAAEQAAEAMRQRLSVPVLCQGDDMLATLMQDFAANPATCLFGTLSLWQGVDVPGESCQLVVIDRIPFPRPDDPVSAARQDAVTKARGNAFMAVAASQAALLLAQGVGRLIRTTSDRGVVAVLDSRLATARYSEFLRASLPPLWPTTDGEVVLAALRRLNQAA